MKTPPTPSDAYPDRSSPLGRAVEFVQLYTPSLLHSMPRADSRDALGIEPPSLPFMGEDLWTAYELSWLDGKGRPQMGALRLTVPASSVAIVESKSMKLYLNSFAQTRFNQEAEVLTTVTGDLSLAFRTPIQVEMLSGADLAKVSERLPGRSLDALDVAITTYERAPELLALTASSQAVSQTWYTRAFRSLCPVTGQPDWATLVVEYSGQAIEPQSLYRYLISYRSHQGFHEATVEQVFMDLLQRCACEQLSVWARFTRRGGIDINPYRSNCEPSAPQMRMPQQ